jgi:acyl-CoA thioester hydrolase
MPSRAADALGAAFTHQVRVYWEDTDAGGIVFYANYLKFFERARTEWLRAAGIAQQALVDETGAIFIVTDTRVRYWLPARLDDLLSVSVEPIVIGRARLTLRQQCRRGTELLSEGTIEVACVSHGTFRPQRIPTPVLQRLLPQATNHPE